MNFNVITIITIVVLLFSSCQKEVETPIKDPEKGFLKGVVKNQFGQPIPEVKIEVEMGNSNFITNSNSIGEFEIAGIFVGTRSVSFSKDGFLGQTLKVIIEKDKITPLEATLASGKGYLLVSDSTFLKQFTPQEWNISILSNSNWIVENSSAWIKVDKTEGKGNGELKFNLVSNDTPEKRSGKVSIVSGDIKREINIEQIPKAMIVKANPVLGFMAENVNPDSVRLEFNTPVKIKSIQHKFLFCLPNFPFQFFYKKDNREVTFEYSCGDPGQSYGFTIQFEDFHGNSYVENFEVDFFDKKLVLDGYFHRKAFDKDGNTLWIQTVSKNLLYKISLNDFSIIKKFDLPYNPGGFSINNATNEIYVYYSNKSYIDVFDKENFSFRRKIQINVNPTDHPEHPVIYPQNLEFSSSGKGILSVSAISSSAERWYMIDSKKNDEITIHPQYGIYPNLTAVDFIYPNYDYSKLYVISPNYFYSFAVYDPVADIFTIEKSKYPFRPVRLIPNRTNNTAIFLQNFVQSIVNPITGFETMKFDIQAINDNSSDFTYNPQKPLSTYYYLLKYLMIFDYSKGEFREMFMRFNDISELVSSKNGDALFLFKKIGSLTPGTDHYSVEIYRVPTSYLPTW